MRMWPAQVHHLFLTLIKIRSAFLRPLIHDAGLLLVHVALIIFLTISPSELWCSEPYYRTARQCWFFTSALFSWVLCPHEPLIPFLFIKFLSISLCSLPSPEPYCRTAKLYWFLPMFLVGDKLVFFQVLCYSIPFLFSFLFHCKIQPWSEQWEMPFDVDVCHVLQGGSKNIKFDCEVYKRNSETYCVLRIETASSLRVNKAPRRGIQRTPC